MATNLLTYCFKDHPRWYIQGHWDCCADLKRAHQCCVHFLLQSAGRLDKPLIITANTCVVASVCALTAGPKNEDHGLTNLSRIKV